MSIVVAVFLAALVAALIGSTLSAVFIIRALTWGLKDELETYGDKTPAEYRTRA